MGASIGGGRNGRGRMRQNAEINVAPMVDVMLVLLVIFIVAAPLLTAGVEVDLPETEAQNISEQIEPLTVTVTADGTIFVQDTEIEYDNLVPHLQAIAEAGYDQRIYIRGDKSTIYDNVAKVMARISAAGFGNMSLVME